ncbi:MAG: SURF1 family protein [Parvibaculaceae bacterium]
MMRKAWHVLAGAAVGCAILIGLGVWQLDRLAWKEALIADRDARGAAPPITLSAAIAMDDPDFYRVEAKGAFLHEGELFYLTTVGGKPGFEVVTPLLTADGLAVLVDRGFVPEEMRDPASRPGSQPAGEVEIVGQVSRHEAGQGYFIPDNNAGTNYWYWWDVPAMLTYSHIPEGRKTVPFILHAVPTPGEKAVPQPVGLGQNLSNNHLQYALTWFSLAAVLAVIAGLMVGQEAKRARA